MCNLDHYQNPTYFVGSGPGIALGALPCSEGITQMCCLWVCDLRRARELTLSASSHFYTRHLQLYCEAHFIPCMSHHISTQLQWDCAFSCPRKSSAKENLGALLEEPKFNKKKIQCEASNLRLALHVLSICVQNKLVNHSSLLPFLPWSWVYVFSPVNCQVNDSQGTYILRGRKCQE